MKTSGAETQVVEIGLLGKTKKDRYTKNLLVAVANEHEARLVLARSFLKKVGAGIFLRVARENNKALTMNKTLPK